MKIFVVNLATAVKRREHIIAQLNDQNVKFEIFDAVDGREKHYYKDKFYNSWLRKLCFARPLSDGQIGCFASHYELWKKCVELDEPIVILEDDIYISSDFSSKLNYLEPKLRKFEFIRLAATFKQKSWRIEDGVKLFKEGPRGTTGYVITPIAATKFIQHIKNLIEPVDDYIDKYWVHGVMPYCIDPEIVSFNNDFDSSVPLNKSRVFFGFKITREIYRLYSKIRKAIFDILYNK